MPKVRSRSIFGARRRVVGCWLALLVACAPGAGADDDATALAASGPLPLRDRFVLDLGFLALTPAPAELLKAGRWRLTAVGSFYNSWSQSEAIRSRLERRANRGNLRLEELQDIEPLDGQKGLYHGDGQVHVVEIEIRRGLGRRLELWLRGSAIDTSGGFADSFVEGFHDLLGLSDASRDFLVRNEYTAYLRTPEGRELYRGQSSGLELGDLALGLRVGLPSPGNRWMHSIEAVVELPTGSTRALAGSGSIDAGMSYQAELVLGRTRLRASLAAVEHGANKALFLDSRLRLTGWLGLEHPLASRTSILLQWSRGQSRFRDLKITEIVDAVSLIDLGFKRRFNGLGVVFVALTQNLGRSAMSDFGIHLGWRRDF